MVALIFQLIQNNKKKEAAQPVSFQQPKFYMPREYFSTCWSSAVVPHSSSASPAEFIVSVPTGAAATSLPRSAKPEAVNTLHDTVFDCSSRMLRLNPENPIFFNFLTKKLFNQKLIESKTWEKSKNLKLSLTGLPPALPHWFSGPRRFQQN